MVLSVAGQPIETRISHFALNGIQVIKLLLKLSKPDVSSLPVLFGPFVCRIKRYKESGREERRRKQNVTNNGHDLNEHIKRRYRRLFHVVLSFHSKSKLQLTNTKSQ